MKSDFEETSTHRSRRRGVGRGSSTDSGQSISRDIQTTAKAKKGRVRRIVIMAVLEVIVLFGIFSYAYVIKQYNKIQRPDFAEENVKNEDLSIEDIQKMEGYWNIAVFGVDSRNSSVGKGNNSDVIMIASINRGTGEIRLVSVFRDSYLKISDNSYNKINAAYANGGPEQAVKALNQNLDLDIKDYVTFNWKAVATGINILGGVDINLSKAELHYINSYITETVKATGIGSVQISGVGEHHLDGVQAVAYARLRYMDNDFARTERQREIVSQAFDKAKKADIATLNSLLGNMLSMVATNLTWQDGLDAIDDIGGYHLGETGGFPFARGDANMGSKGACVIPQTLESNVKDLHKFLFDDEDYQVSESVKKISAKISSDTGMYNEGTYVDHVSTDGGYIGYGESTKSNASSSHTSGSSSSSTKEAPESTEVSVRDQYGNIVKYPAETDEYGEIKYIYETNSAGNVIGIYETDAYGNIVPAEVDIDEPESIPETSATRATDEYGHTLPAETIDEGNLGPGEPSASTKPTSSETSIAKPTTGESSAAKPTTGGSSTVKPSTSPEPTTAPISPTTAPSITAPTAPTAATTEPGVSGGPGSGSNETVAAKPE